MLGRKGAWWPRGRCAGRVQVTQGPHIHRVTVEGDGRPVLSLRGAGGRVAAVGEGGGGGRPRMTQRGPFPGRSPNGRGTGGMICW
ncbi:hypothetical protein [Streptomyces sp. NA02950]|uniref:hypothetical protein n=1 Tax=Streptomyces sp. NA02950 TaxID=2742137 RepID=UPI0034CE68C1